MRTSLHTVILLTILAMAGVVVQEEPPRSWGVAQVLDDFHDAASHADGARYFGHFADDGVFLGTDPDERWTVREFRAYASPFFDAGQGWTYRPVNRHIVKSAGGTVAWFDELLDNAKYGRCRGTGVLVREGGSWKIAQYSLTFVIPNDCALEALEACRGR